jgi:hypothetical protein
MADELPVEGFPISGDAVHTWFVDRHGREPSAEELTRIINAMSEREATPPLEGGPDWTTRRR